MKLVVFGLGVSSSWGNGHATLWRGLGRALARRGHTFVFFERDVPYYAAHRDQPQPPGIDLRLYRTWEAVANEAAKTLADADAGFVTSYCPDAAAATALVLASRVAIKCFYDLDTPVTLAALSEGRSVPWVGARGLRDFDLVLSFTGGRALSELETRLGARRAAPLYGSVDPEVHQPPTGVRHTADLSYLGTYSADRQQALQALLLEPARRLPDRRFLIGGPQYPAEFPWRENISYISHVAPGDHPRFYGAAPLTLNITRGPFAALGYCPSARLFEAAACGVPVLSDDWEGLGRFFIPRDEILVARDTAEAMDAISLRPEELARIGARARDRALAEHTADHRATELLRMLEGALSAQRSAREAAGTLEAL